jgi:hypothetical protein
MGKIDAKNDNKMERGQRLTLENPYAPGQEKKTILNLTFYSLGWRSLRKGSERNDKNLYGHMCKGDETGCRSGCMQPV